MDKYLSILGFRCRDVVSGFEGVAERLKGEPEQILTLILYGLALVAVLIAAKGDASLKALAIFWIVSP